MARAADQFRQSDVTMWGIVALAVGAVALLSANVSALVPDSVLAALHSSRLSGANVNELRSDITSLTDRQTKLDASGEQLTSRFQATERTTGDMLRRVSALEVSVPNVTEALRVAQATNRPLIDTSLTTGSIGAPPRPGFNKGPLLPADGGSVRVTHTPLLQAAVATPPKHADVSPAGSLQPMPASLALHDDDITTPDPTIKSEKIAPLGEIAPTQQQTDHPAATEPKPIGNLASVTASQTASAAPAADVKAFGVAVGAPIDAAGAPAAWKAISGRIGPLLNGLSPLLAENPSGRDGKVLVAGPISSIEAATTLCANFDRAGIDCIPMPYVGAALSAAGNSK